MSPRILIVDDEAGIRFGLQDFLENHGFEVLEAGSGEEAIAYFDQTPPDLILLDYQLPDGTALDFLPRLRSREEGVPVFILTAFGSIEVAVQAVKLGAEQFLTKPVEWSSLLVMIQRTLEHRHRQRLLDGKAPRQSEPDPFLGSSRAIAELRLRVERLLPSDIPVLLLGETGTGKSLLARWIHEHGPRSAEGYLDLNCAGLQKDFLENELFGHERGAYTGAHQAKQGLLEVAHEGTVFLDEVGDMDPSIQVKLLKVIEEKRFRRMGSLADRKVDIRLIAATHQDLEGLIQTGRFRSDLYYRLNALTLRIPPLRQRVEDVEPLAKSLLASISRDLKLPAPCLSSGALEAIRAYPWPGNIRELRNALERACLYAIHEEIRAEDFALPVRPRMLEAHEASGESTLQQLTRDAVQREVDLCEGNISEAARKLGIARSTVYQKLKSPHPIS
jgi:DNA-binding NtrC family response regulator